MAQGHTLCELKMYLVQAIIGVNFATVAASTFMASNNSHRNTLLHTILQLNAEQAVIEQWDFNFNAKLQDPTLAYQPNASAWMHGEREWNVSLIVSSRYPLSVVSTYVYIHAFMERERAKCQFNSLISIPFVCGVYVYVYTHACMKKEQEREQNVSLIVSWKSICVWASPYIHAYIQHAHAPMCFWIQIKTTSDVFLFDTTCTCLYFNQKRSCQHNTNKENHKKTPQNGEKYWGIVRINFLSSSKEEFFFF